METNRVQQILHNPKFQQLTRRKRQLSWALTALMGFIYFGYIALVAWFPSFLHQSLFGGVITVGIPLGVGVILSAFGLCGIYVWRANAEFDRLTQEVVEDIQQ